MPYDPHKHHRRSIRLKGYDYTQAGAYFVTICAQDRDNLFGQITDGEIDLDPAGKMIHEVWSSLPEKYPTVQLDAFVIMPNHIHFIVLLTDDTPVRATPYNPSDTHVGVDPRVHPDPDDSRPSLPDVVRWFKSLTTAKYRHGVQDEDWPPFPGRVWQRNYYEHIIRNQRSLNAIREYIENNPANWLQDKLYER